MRIVQLTPGTGSFLCGSCLRDNALVRALARAGHDATISPLYLPFALEDQGTAAPLREVDEGVHLGGINVYLQETGSWSRWIPRPVANALDSPRLLRFVASHATMTDASKLGPMTLSVLRGADGRQAREVERLVEWLETGPKPDVVLLSNAMLIGLAAAIRDGIGCPVVCTLQGEAPFLDALPPDYASAAWSELASRANDVAGFIAVSEYTGALMRERLGLADEAVHVVPNGIELGEFEPQARRPERPTIGYLARMCPDKGLDRLIDAFLELRAGDRVPGMRLLAGGVLLGEDRAWLRGLEERVRADGAEADVELRPNLSKEAKHELFAGCSLVSVPALYGESFGLYVIEALACGVPVVQPRTAGFTEIVEATGGGTLYDPERPGAYAEALEALLLDEERACALGREGRRAVLERYGADRMAEDVARVCRMLATPA